MQMPSPRLAPMFANLVPAAFGASARINSLILLIASGQKPPPHMPQVSRLEGPVVLKRTDEGIFPEVDLDSEGVAPVASALYRPNAKP